MQSFVQIILGVAALSATVSAVTLPPNRDLSSRWHATGPIDCEGKFKLIDSDIDYLIAAIPEQKIEKPLSYDWTVSRWIKAVDGKPHWITLSYTLEWHTGEGNAPQNGKWVQLLNDLGDNDYACHLGI